MSDELYVYRVYLDGEITEDKAREVIADLHYASTEYPGCEIEFVINSSGGTVADGAAIFSELRAMSKRGGGTHYVTTVVRGFCASIATVILEAGDWRVGGLLDELMYHETTVCFHDEFISHARARLAEIDAWESAYLDLVMERAKVPREEIEALTGPIDVRIRVPEAIRLGLMDAVA